MLIPVMVEQSTHGVSSEEQAGIRAEIDEAFRNQRELHSETRFQYTPTRRVPLLPVLLNLGALVVTAVAVVLLFVLFERDERALVEVSAAGAAAEARVLEQFRAEVDALLSEREREIARIQAELDRLSRLAPPAQRDQATAGRIAVLEAELERALEDERVLVREVDSATTLAGLQRLQQQERLMAAQLSAALARITELEAELAGFAERAAAPDPAAAPPHPRQTQPREPLIIGELAQEGPAELSDLRNAVRRLESDIERLQGERDRLTAERASLASRQSQLIDERDRLSAGTARLQNRVTQLERELASARSAEQYRAVLRARLDGLSRAVAGALVTAEPGREELLRKVEVKLEVLRILSTEPVRGSQPGLDSALEDYIDTLAAESRREGRIAGLREALELIERIGGSGTVGADIDGRFAASERAAVNRILSELGQLLR
ncbi:MAG: hypothetical protein EA384_09065 [Spirochaetaceae bacterium]|nr:MAG: hypothetical protein EA384_09065 [Spirochaetaceae bacterium]